MWRQRGYALLELSLAVLLSTLIAAWSASALMARVDEMRAQSSAQWMLTVQDAAAGYLSRHDHDLTVGGAAGKLAESGYADWAAPTVAELRAQGLLPPGFPLHVKPGGGARVRILRGRGCPGPACTMQALVHSETPFLKEAFRGVGTAVLRAEVDERLVANWLLAAGGKGGWVNPRRPEYVAGPVFSWPNPAWEGPPLPPGTVALSVSAVAARGQTSIASGSKTLDILGPFFQDEAGHCLPARGGLAAGAGLTHCDCPADMYPVALANVRRSSAGGTSGADRAAGFVCIR
ncbi:hypothetical protein ERD78_08930 [Allopusillimonas soli]|uniref:Uncharacterized protein n=1 Tax=Allopusillimonas soli TaxID=659016 RepID=A0A853FG60_9BURK|nr:hypothetical protein [Allopusillimonas soli]NYT36996.1 hypothetical protein [Allopusillimonas soli]TEA75442.1 hypothetical protein ERD78_08930 [Allopusillimonas soli]